MPFSYAFVVCRGPFRTKAPIFLLPSDSRDAHEGKLRHSLTGSSLSPFSRWKAAAPPSLQ